MMNGPQFTRPQSMGLSCSGAMLESYHKLQLKPKTVPKFNGALQLIWSALLEKTIDNFVKDYRKRLQACVSANGIKCDNSYNRYHLLYLIKCHLA